MAEPVSKVGSSRKPGKPKGLPKSGGRAKGVPNKATVSIKEAAREYTEAALQTLVSVMKDDEAPHAAKVSAANSILDRGYGKASTVISGDEDGNPAEIVHHILLEGVSANG